MSDPHRPPLMTRLRRMLLGDRPARGRARWSDGGPGELFAPTWDTPFDEPPKDPVELDRDDLPWELRGEGGAGGAGAAPDSEVPDAGAGVADGANAPGSGASNSASGSDPRNSGPTGRSDSNPGVSRDPS